MRILFVQTNSNTALIPLPIGATMVAARLREDGHTVRFVDLMGEKRPADIAAGAAREFNPELVCYSIRNRDNQTLERFADPLPGIRDVVAAVRGVTPAPALLGGTAFSTYPARMLQYMNAEYGLAGDDLGNVSRFVASLAKGPADLSTPGLVYRAPSGRITENPYVISGYRQPTVHHVDFIEKKRYRRAYWDAAVVTRSGCPERCVYCDTYKTFGRDFVLREPADVAAELLALKMSGRARSAWFVDAGSNSSCPKARNRSR